MHSSFNMHLLGWRVEVTGRSVIRRTGCVLEPDRELFDRAYSPARVESLEDLLAEMLAMDRPAPKGDKERVLGVLEQPGYSLDLAYFRRRCIGWRVSRDVYRETLEVYARAHAG
jgi:hypothetical protein